MIIPLHELTNPLRSQSQSISGKSRPGRMCRCTRVPGRVSQVRSITASNRAPNKPPASAGSKFQPDALQRSKPLSICSINAVVRGLPDRPAGGSDRMSVSFRRHRNGSSPTALDGKTTSGEVRTDQMCRRSRIQQHILTPNRPYSQTDRIATGRTRQNDTVRTDQIVAEN